MINSYFTPVAIERLCVVTASMQSFPDLVLSLDKDAPYSVKVDNVKSQ